MSITAGGDTTEGQWQGDQQNLRTLSQQHASQFLSNTKNRTANRAARN
jgi:hypothetical protein